MRTIELLQCNLKPGTGRDFHKLMVEESAPLHRAAGIDIVAFGNSLHDEDAYYLINNIAHLEASQTAFYLSDEWKQGPQEAIVERIQTSFKSVMMLLDAAINALRN